MFTAADKNSPPPFFAEGRPPCPSKQKAAASERIPLPRLRPGCWYHGDSTEWNPLADIQIAAAQRLPLGRKGKPGNDGAGRLTGDGAAGIEGAAQVAVGQNAGAVKLEDSRSVYSGQTADFLASDAGNPWYQSVYEYDMNNGILNRRF